MRRGSDLDGLTVAVASVMVHAFIGLVMWAAIDAFVTRPPLEEETIIEIVEELPPEPKEPEPEPEPEVQLPPVAPS